MQHPNRQRLAALLGLLALAACLQRCVPAAAEDFADIGGEKFTGVKRSGAVVRVRSGVIEVNAGDKLPLTVLVSQDSLNAAFAKHKDKTKRDVLLKCDVVGTADFNFLRKDHGVSFSAELDKQRNGVEEIKELTVFTVDDPGKLSLIDTQPALEEGKSAPAKGGYFQVNGQINQLRKDGFTAKAMAEQGQKSVPVSIKVRVALDAKVNLKVADYLLAKPGDAIEIEGFTFTKNKKDVTGMILAETVSITLAKPVGQVEKPKPAVARTDRRALTKQTADDDEEMPSAARPVNGLQRTAAKEANDLSPEPGDPLPGKLIFRDSLSVDADDSMVEPQASARASAKSNPPAAPAADAGEP